MEVERLRISEESYKGLYDEQKEKVDILEEVLKFSTAEQIKRDQETIKELTSERDSLKGRVDSYDQQIEELKKAYDIAKRNIERELRVEKEQQLVDYKKNTNYKKIKPLEEKINGLNVELDSIKKKLEQAEVDKDIAEKKVVEVETLLKSRDEEIERLKTIEEKVDTIYNYLISNLQEIRDMLVNGSNKEEIISHLEEVEETAKERVSKSKEELEAEDKEIINMLISGKSKSEVADVYYSHLDDAQTRRVQLSKRMKSKRFISIADSMGYKN